MKLSILGCGRWGGFLAWYTSSVLGQRVTLYGREGSARMAEFKKSRSNGLVVLDEAVCLTSNLEEAVCASEILILSISAQNLRALMQQLSAFDLENRIFVLCMKGLEAGTGKRLSQIVREYVPASAQVAVWVGPGHVQDFVQGIPNCMVIDSDREETKRLLIRTLGGELIRFYYGSDLLGNEVGAAAKNVVGIAAGMLDGVNKTALKGALMARGTREIARLVAAMGGNPVTVYGLSHLGDYQATVFSPYSHNRRFGELFVQGKPYGELAEGVATTLALLKLGREYQVELPICEAVNRVVNEHEKPETVLSDLFLRSIKQEFEADGSKMEETAGMPQ